MPRPSPAREFGSVYLSIEPVKLGQMVSQARTNLQSLLFTPAIEEILLGPLGAEIWLDMVLTQMLAVAL